MHNLVVSDDAAADWEICSWCDYDARPTMKILLQTTIPTTKDDWSIARFSQLAACLSGLRDNSNQRRFEVTVRDRNAPGAPDPILSTLDRQPFDELWLFAVDEGSGLTPEDCEGISRFWLDGGGLLVARDHMDLGSSVCGLRAIGGAHHFHTKNLDPDESMRRIDDPYTKHISWPNFHSGSNGDYHEIRPMGRCSPRAGPSHIAYMRAPIFARTPP